MRLNGYPVIKRQAHPDVPGYLSGIETVMVFREGHPHHPYVVATWAPQMGTEWHNGDYCETLEKANVRFNKRAALRG